MTFFLSFLEDPFFSEKADNPKCKTKRKTTQIPQKVIKMAHFVNKAGHFQAQLWDPSQAEISKCPEKKTKIPFPEDFATWPNKYTTEIIKIRSCLVTTHGRRKLQKHGLIAPVFACFCWQKSSKC